MSSVTCIAPVNIAVIKYWGKRNEKLILPLNDSISVTLSTDEMHAKTTVMVSSDLKEDKIWLNGKEESIENSRLKACIEAIRSRAVETEIGKDWRIHICSENNFPTAAGLASSAAGYACLVYTLAHLYGIKGDISSIARQGSGSACRSVFGGFVRWHKGELPDGSDSVAKQLFPASYWPTLRILILFVSDNKKKTSSTDGMQRSVLTSELLNHRVAHCVPRRTEEIIHAIEAKNFEQFAEITMRDSNQFHSVCLDTYPPAVYMNDVSHRVVEFVHAYNKTKGITKLGYTFDAGPNGCLFLEENDVSEVVTLIKRTFPPPEEIESFVRGIHVQETRLQEDLKLPTFETGLIKYIIHTKIGEGPQVVKGQNLLNENGLPK